MKLKFSLFPFALLAASAPLANLEAADITWDAGGGVDTLWTNGNNWNGANTVPTAADSAVIGGTGNVDATGMATVDAMRLTRAVTISNGTIDMDASANGAGSGIFQIDTGSYAATIGSNLLFSGSTITGTVSTFRLHNGYAGTTTISGTTTVTNNIGQSGSAFMDISGAAGTTGTITFNNSIAYTRTTGNTDFNLNRGTMELNAANTWNLGGGSFRFNPQVTTGTGTLKLGHSTALGVSTNDLYLGTTDATIGSTTYVMQTLQTGTSTVANRVFIRNSALITVLGADIASGTATYSGNITLNNVTTGGTAGAINLKSVQAGGTVDFTGVIANGNTGQAVVRNLTIGDATTGLGTVKFSNANTFTGTTTVAAGILEISGSGSLANTSSVTLTGGTLLLGASDRINNSAGFTTGGGGKIQISGASNFTETVGSLSLGTGTSVIDFGNLSGTNILTFAASALDAPGTLQVWNWSGNVALGGGTDRLFFGNSSSGLTGGTSGSVEFFTGPGSGSLGFGTQLPTGELVPVPEPSGLLAALGLLGLTFRRDGRHRHRSV